MRTKHLTAYASGWIMRPSHGVVLALGGAFAGWVLFIKTTARFPSVWREETFRFMPSEHYWPLTIVNVLLGAWLLYDLRCARRAAPGLVRGQASGAVLGFALVALIQYAAHSLHRAWPMPVEDRVVIDAHVASVPGAEGRVFADLRTLLSEHLPVYRERLLVDNACLCVAGDGEQGGDLSYGRGVVSLRLYGERRDVPAWNAEDSDIRIESRSPHSIEVRVPTSAEPRDLAGMQSYVVSWIEYEPTPR
jgi:hypothetical protein